MLKVRQDRKTLLWGAIALSLVLMALVLPSFGDARTASAHANQIRTSPPPDSELETAPERVIVWFSEPIEPRLSRIRVLDQEGRQVDNEDSQLSPTESTAMVVTLPALENGTYTAVWGNTSTVDGHSVVGSFRFAVGEPLSEAVQIVEQPLLQAQSDPWLRWLFFVGALAFAGSLIFEFLVVAPVLGTAEAGTPGNRLFIQMTRLVPRLAWPAAGLMVAGLLGLLVQQAAVSFDVPLVDAFGEPLRTVLFDTDWGRQWTWRMLAVVLAAVFVILATRIGGAASRSDEDAPVAVTETVYGQLALAASLAFIFLTSLTSHNAASAPEVRLPAILSDFIHFLAAAAWIGGLFFLTVWLRWSTRSSDNLPVSALSDALPRFSRIAIVSAGTLVVTGIFSGWMQVTVPEATATPHGWALVAKIVLMVPLFAFAALNSYRITRRLMADPAALRIFRKLVSAEALLGLLILLAVGWLAGLEPARQYASRNGIGVDESRSFSDTAEGVRIDLEVAPGNVGQNSVTVKLEDLRGRTIDNASEVRVLLRFLEDDLAEPTQSLVDQGGGVWSGDDFRLAIGGIYQAEVVVRRPDGFDARTAFRFEALSAGSIADALRPTETPTWVLFGIELLIIGALLAFAGAPGVRLMVQPSASGAFSGAVVAGAGALILLNATVMRIGFEEERFNPFPPTPASLASGSASYATTCSACHGDSGLGDGPQGVLLDTPPADLSIHVPLHTDGELFGFIRDGIPGTAMVGNGDVLSDEEMWNLVNFIRTFEG